MYLDKPVVVITSNLYKPNIGGVENSLYHLAKSYLNQGLQPIIVASDIASSESKLPEYEEVEGILVYRYAMNKSVRIVGLPLPKSLSGIVNAVSLYRQINKQYKPKFTIARYHFNQLFAKWAGLNNTIYLVPGVVKFQNSMQHIEKRGMKSNLQCIIIGYYSI